MKLFRLASACALAASMFGTPDAHAEGKVLKVSLNTELQILDPITTTTNAVRVFAYMVYDTLVSMDSEGNFKPQMLDKWDISADKLTYTFTLRDGLEWSDGTPVTADDCVASITRWAKRDGFGGAMMAAVDDLKATDAKHFVMHLKRPFAFVIQALGRAGHQVPVMMPARLARMDAFKPVPEVIGSGPFIFLQKQWRPGDVASFVPNPHYHPRAEAPDGLAGGKVVKIDRVDLVSVPDQATRAAALQTGELDWLEAAPLDFVATMRKQAGVTVGKPRGMDQYLAVININHAAPPFNNIKVRKALQAAIVQPEIMAAMGLPDDLVTPFCGSIYMCGAPGTSDAGIAELKKASAAHARELLKDSGYKGEPVIVLHSSTSALLNPVGLVVADQLKQAGFNVDLVSTDYATVAQRRLSKSGWGVAPVVYNGIDLMNPLASPLVSYNCTDNALGWYCDPKMTDLLREYSEASDPAAQKRLKDAIQADFHDNVDYVIAGQFGAPGAWRSSLNGVVPFSFPIFWNISRK